MVKKSNAAVSAVLGLAFAGALLGVTTPASAAPGQVCYFGECAASASPNPTPPQRPVETRPAETRPDAPREVSQRGSWHGVQAGPAALVYDRFDNGAKFAIVFQPEGRLGLMLSHPQWHLRKGQEVEVSIHIDREVYNGKAMVNDSGVLEADDVGKALVTAFYRGHKAQIVVGDYTFDMNSLPDAAAVIDDVLASQRRAGR